MGQQEREHLAADEACRAAKFLRPTLQIFSEKDDVEASWTCFSVLQLNTEVAPGEIGYAAHETSLR